MKTIFEKIDALPIVRILQSFAVIFLLLSSGHIGQILYQAYEGYNGTNILIILNMFFMSITNMMYTPLVLLALAEIIKLLKANLSLRQNHKIEENE